MPRIVNVQAVAAFHYDGHVVHAGDRVTMRPLDALVAHRLGHISLTRPLRDPAPRAVAAAVAPPEPAAPDARRRYRRRDLQPEP